MNKEAQKNNKEMDISIEDLEKLLEEVRQGQLSSTSLQLIERIIILIQNLYIALKKKKVSIKEVKKIFFSDKEHNKQQTESKENKEEIDINKLKNTNQEKPKRKGHGRNGVDKYKGAKRVYSEHKQIKEGERCPDKKCKGHLKKYYRNAKFIRLEGQAPVAATIYEQEILRCSACQYCYTAPLPEKVKPEKYAATADAMIVMCKYGYAIPSNRLANVQQSLGVPLPASVQWQRIETVANILLPLFLYMQILSAQAEILYHDDTKVRILRALPSKNDKRTGLFTTGIVTESEDKKIAIYKSGRNHAGENASELLEKRNKELETIKKMSDASSNNNSPKITAIIMLCLAHARGKFKKIADIFTKQCEIVIKIIGLIYDNEEQTKTMSRQQRLVYHQEKSVPLLEKLKEKIKQDFDRKEVEPNDALGQAYNYLENNWQELTQFTRLLGAPLDNNIVERMLRMAVLHRKNSLFYRNDMGAFCGDICMSIIQTAKLNHVNPYIYITKLIENEKGVRSRPENFLPWNFEQNQKTQKQSLAI